MVSCIRYGSVSLLDVFYLLGIFVLGYISIILLIVQIIAYVGFNILSGGYAEVKIWEKKKIL